MARELDHIDLALLDSLNDAGREYADAKQAASEAKIKQEQADRTYEEATLRARAQARQSLPSTGSNGKPLTVDAAKELLDEAVMALTEKEANAAYAAADDFTRADARLSIARESLRNVRAGIELYTRGGA